MTTNDGADGRRAALSPTLETGLGFTLGRVHRRLRAAWEVRIADLGLTGPSASVVRAVVEHPGIGVRELARRLATDPMNAKRLVDVLERDGLLRSDADPDDQRRRRIHPTPAGRRVHRALVGRAAAWRDLLATILAPDDAEHLWRLLVQLEDGIAEIDAVEDARPETQDA